MKFREFLILVLIIAAGTIFYFARKGAFPFEGRIEWDAFHGGQTYEFEESRILEAPLPSAVTVLNLNGNVDIRSDDQDNIRLILHKTVRKRTEKEARETAGRLMPIITRSEDRLVLATNRQDFKADQIRTNFTIIVPRHMDVAIDNAHGTVTLTGIRTGTIDNRHGRIIAADIKNDLTVRGGSEDIDISRVGASCRIESRRADITVRQIGGNVRIDHSYGTVSVEDAAADVLISGNQSTISCLRIAGKTDLGTTYRNISLSDTGPAVVRIHHGSASADRIRGGLKVSGAYSDVRLNDVNGPIVIEGRSVTISGTSLSGPEIRTDTSYGNVKLLDFAGNAFIRVSHGNAVLAPASPGVSLNVNNSYSRIRLVLPKGECGPLEARSLRGQIVWRLLESPSLHETNRESVLKAFLRNTGLPALSLATSDGDIIIENKDSPQTEEQEVEILLERTLNAALRSFGLRNVWI